MNESTDFARARAASGAVRLGAGESTNTGAQANMAMAARLVGERRCGSSHPSNRQGGRDDGSPPANTAFLAYVILIVFISVFPSSFRFAAWLQRSCAETDSAPGCQCGQV